MFEMHRMWTRNVQGKNYRSVCVPCNGNEIKSVSGDDPTLCTETCDGVTNVANADHTVCGKNYLKYFNKSLFGIKFS